MAAGSAVAMIGANLRFGINPAGNGTMMGGRVFQCHPGGTREAALVLTLGGLGIAANLTLMAVILGKRQLRRWSQGLLFHQAIVDCARAAILIPLGLSIFRCQPVNKCSLVETAFLLLVTVSTVNMLTTVLNDSPVFPEDEDDENDLTGPLLMDSPQCVLFGAFMIWFASITINLGPTFLSGALAANSEYGHNTPSCPLVHGPFRHYVLNVLWILINLICVVLTLFHLRKLHRDLTKANVEAVRVAGLVTTLVSVTGGGIPHHNQHQHQHQHQQHDQMANGGSIGGGESGKATPAQMGTPARVNSDIETRANGALEEHRRMRNYLRRMEQEGVQRVKMFLIITAAYVMFWGPLFFVTLVHHPLIGNQLGYEITLHISYFHAFINPTLFLMLHRSLRQALLDLCCGCCFRCTHFIFGLTDHVSNTLAGNSPPNLSALTALNLPPPPDPPSISDISLLKAPALPLPPPPPGDGMPVIPTVLPHSELRNANLMALGVPISSTTVTVQQQQQQPQHDPWMYNNSSAEHKELTINSSRSSRAPPAPPPPTQQYNPAATTDHDSPPQIVNHYSSPKFGPTLDKCPRSFTYND